MDLKQVIKQSLIKLENQDPEILVGQLKPNDQLSIDVGAFDIRDKEDCGNYCFFPGFIDLLKPAQIVELGSAMGVAAICMLQSPHKNFDLYGVTLKEHGLEFCYINKTKYQNLTCIIGDYMNLSVWPKEVDLKKTDLWYIDGLHEGQHVRKQLELYKPFFKQGAIILFDDIHINVGMNQMWCDIEELLPVDEKMDLANPLHWSGFGVIKLK